MPMASLSVLCKTDWTSYLLYKVWLIRLVTSCIKVVMDAKLVSDSKAWWWDFMTQHEVAYSHKYKNKNRKMVNWFFIRKTITSFCNSIINRPYHPYQENHFLIQHFHQKHSVVLIFLQDICLFGKNALYIIMQ